MLVRNAIPLIRVQHLKSNANVLIGLPTRYKLSFLCKFPREHDLEGLIVVHAQVELRDHFFGLNFGAGLVDEFDHSELGLFSEEKDFESVDMDLPYLLQQKRNLKIFNHFHQMLEELRGDDLNLNDTLKNEVVVSDLLKELHSEV